MNKTPIMNHTITPSIAPPRWHKHIPGLGLALLLLGGAVGAVAQPANDNFANAITLSGDGGTQTGTSTIGATFQAGEPTCVYPGICTNTVWFEWTASADGNFTISTTGSTSANNGNNPNTEWDAVLCIYTGNTLSTLFPVLQQDSGLDETATIPVTAGTTYYFQLGGDSGWPPDDAANILLTWSFVVPPPPTVVPISNATTPVDPLNPAGGVNINSTVGAGNIGELVGLTQTHWASQGFYNIGIELNTNTLIVDTGGGNVPYYAYGDISGTGTVIFNTANNPDNPTPIDVRGNNSYVGSTTVEQGLISLDNPDGQTALLGTITVGSEGAGYLQWTYAGNQIDDAATVTLVASGSYLNLNGFPETFNTLTLPSGTSVKTGLGTNNNLNVTTLIMNGTTYTTGYYGVTEAPGFVTGSGYILVGGTPPPAVTEPPAEPSTPSPADTTTGIEPLSQTLSWADSVGATSYDLYLWLASGSKPGTPTAPGLTVAHYAAPSPLNDYAEYEWQVVANNTAGSTPGPDWTFTTTSRTNISNTLGPLQDGGLNIDAIVGAGNAGRLVGTVQTYWNSHGFTVPLDLNTNELIVDSGGGNVPFGAYGPISGMGTVAYNTVNTSGGKISVSGNNTYGGTTVVKGGWISLENITSGNALLGTITVGSSSAGTLAWNANDQISDDSDVILTNGSYLVMNGYSDTIKSLTMPVGTIVDTTGGSVLTVSSLTLGGVVQSPGTYDRNGVDSMNYIVGEGSIVVVAAATPPDFPASGFTLPGGVPTFQVPTELGKTYTLFYKNNLTDATWTALTGSGTGAGTGSPITLSDPTASLPAQRFYRLGAQ